MGSRWKIKTGGLFNPPVVTMIKIILDLPFGGDALESETYYPKEGLLEYSGTHF